MKTPAISLTAIIIFSALLACRPKPSEEPTTGVNQNLPNEDNSVQLNSEFPQKAGSDHPPSRTNQSPDLANVLESRRPSYVNLEKDLKDSLARIPPPKSIEEYAAIESAYHKMFVRRKDLLFSIPISSQAEKDRNEVWAALGFGENPAKGFLDGERNKYAKELLNRYLNASQLEKLVIWETVRTRITGAKRGDASGEIFLRIELAKLLFSALGIEKQELFDAVDLKTRAASREAESKASLAEEEIERIHIEQSKVAEKILEQHWKPAP